MLAKHYRSIIRHKNVFAKLLLHFKAGIRIVVNYLKKLIAGRINYESVFIGRYLAICIIYCMKQIQIDRELNIYVAKIIAK